MDDFVSALELDGGEGLEGELDESMIRSNISYIDTNNINTSSRPEFSPVRLPSPTPPHIDLTIDANHDTHHKTSRKRHRQHNNNNNEDDDVQELVDLTDDNRQSPPIKPKIQVQQVNEQAFYFALPSTAAFLINKPFDPDRMKLAFNPNRYPHSFGVGIETDTDQQFVGYIDQSIVPHFSAILSARTGIAVRVVPTATPLVKPGQWQTITVLLYTYGPKALAIKTAQRFPALNIDNRVVIGDIIKPYFGAKTAAYNMNQSQNLKNEQEVFFKLLDEMQEAQDDLEQCNPSTDLKTKLLEYQRKGLAWMIGRENHSAGNPTWQKKHEANELYRHACRDCFGGILADEMGLGKTIQTIALILTNSRNKLGKFEGPTLILAPLSVLTSWEEQIKEHCAKGSLKLYVHHGNRRLTITSMIERYDIVLTTYSTLAQEYSEKEEEESPLHEIEWHRIVLDEAHCIRSYRTKQAKATLALKGKRRWCLTGTPVQNRMDDLYALLAFLKVEPFCQLLEWTRTISNPLKKGDTQGLHRLKILMSIVCLRRLKTMKVDGKRIVNLPEKTVQHVDIILSKQERQTYDVLSNTYRVLVGDMLNDGTILKKYAHVLQLLLRLRQCCNHIALLPEQLREAIASRNSDSIQTADSDSKLVSSAIDDISSHPETECAFCLETVVNPWKTPCNHYFCEKCIKDFIELYSTCPACQTVLSLEDVNSNERVKDSSNTSFLAPQFVGTFHDSERFDLSNLGSISSSKVEMLIRQLIEFRETDANFKCVVFSQWTGMLNLVRRRLDQASIKWVLLDGQMSRNSRAKAMQDFSQDRTIRVFLASLTAGNLGINLTAANRAILLDPWWNPATENQAIDRIHRVGQKRDVLIYKYIAKDTVEERILRLQEKKRQMFETTMETRSKDELRQMMVDDLKELFMT